MWGRECKETGSPVMRVALGIAMSGRSDAGTVVFGETVAWRVSRSIMRHIRGVWP